MAAIWPLVFPCPLLSGFSGKTPNNLIRSDMDTGPAKVRRRGGAKPRQVQASYMLSREQLSILSVFVGETIADGAVCFDWPHPTLGRYVRARMVGGSDGLYSVSPVSPELWQVPLTIEYWPDAPLT